MRLLLAVVTLLLATSEAVGKNKHGHKHGHEASLLEKVESKIEGFKSEFRQFAESNFNMGLFASPDGEVENQFPDSEEQDLDDRVQYVNKPKREVRVFPDAKLVDKSNTKQKPAWYNGFGFFGEEVVDEFAEVFG